MSGITEASRVLSIGKNICFMPSSLASIVAGRAQLIGRMRPSRASSHKNSDDHTISFENSISLPRIPSAIGRS
jgi:topoisomerase IA-like protein